MTELKRPKAFTTLRGTFKTASSQTPVTEVMKSEGTPVDLEKDPQAVSALALDWLPFAAKTYNISPHIEDYVIVTTPICPSGLPNRNGIGFPLSELTRYMPPPVGRQAYKAWAGTPMHLEHDNEDHTKAYGVVLDSMLTQIKGYGGGKYWKVMGLAAIDKNKYPDIAQEILDGTIDTYSMGALSDVLTCSVCGATAYGPKKKYQNCRHISSTDEVNFHVVNYNGRALLAYLNAHLLSPIELSIVRDPAWCVAQSDLILTPQESF